jgi:outer membrane protein assembly factor BamE
LRTEALRSTFPQLHASQMTASFVKQFRIGRLAVAALVLAALGACVHRIDIQQGNFLDKEDIDRISVGMTRVQVRALLGTPMVADPFQGTRWDYVYYMKKGRLRKAEQRHFIVYFDGADKVEKVERPTQAAKS